MAAFFTADTHFGDTHILRKRGARFATIAAHDEALIATWNATVGPTDEIWHLGDFASGADPEHCRGIFSRLNGIKRLVRGNHDTNRVLDLPWADAPAESATVKARDASNADRRLYLAH